MSKHDDVSRRMKLIDGSFERLTKKLLQNNMGSTSAEMHDGETAVVVDDETILINPMKNVPLKVVRTHATMTN